MVAIGRQSMVLRNIIILVACTWALILAPTPVLAAAASTTVQLPMLRAVVADGWLHMVAGESLVLSVNDATRVAVADANVADIAVVSKTEVLVTAKQPGATTLHVWERSGVSSFGVRVDENNSLAERVSAAINRSDIEIRAVQDRLIIEGQLRNQNELNRALQIAATFSSNVVSLVSLTHPTQVLMEVQVLEVDRSVTGQLGMTWGSITRGVLEPNTLLIGEGGTPFQFSRLSTLGAQLDVLMENGQARLLAAPTLLTLSGENAEFVAGGAIPVVMSEDNGKIAVEWKEYGVKLTARPVVDAAGTITIFLTPEVSSLDWANGIKVANVVLPALRTRRAETQVQMTSGETLVLGGMISSEESKHIKKLPLLGDLPILGYLFRSEKFVRGETELLFLVTPYVMEESL